MERLAVLGTKGLVGRGSSGSDDGEGHVELASCRGVRVTGRTDLGHAEDTKVGVHQFDDGTVSVQAFTEGLSDEVAFVDDLIGGTALSVRLLGQLWDVVR